MLRIFCICLIFSPLLMQAGDLQEMVVVAAQGLNLRQKPDLNSPVVTVVPYGSTVSISFGIFGSLTVDGLTGNWQRVKFSGREGYAFNGFLELPANQTAALRSVLASKGSIAALRAYGRYFSIVLMHRASPVCSLTTISGKLAGSYEAGGAGCGISKFEETSSGDLKLSVSHHKCLDYAPPVSISCNNRKTTQFTCLVQRVTIEYLIRGRPVSREGICEEMGSR